jgi:hypothetical protein
LTPDVSWLSLIGPTKLGSELVVLRGLVFVGQIASLKKLGCNYQRVYPRKSQSSDYPCLLRSSNNG